MNNQANKEILKILDFRMLFMVEILISKAAFKTKVWRKHQMTKFLFHGGDTGKQMDLLGGFNSVF